MIYHLVWSSDWETAKSGSHYAPASLEAEGFIHASPLEKVLWVAGEFFWPARDEPLRLLEIDERQLTAPVRYEDPGVGHAFPHIYGPINLDAVVAVRPMFKVSTGWRLNE